MITTVNFFAPHHGKSSVDGIFGFFAHLLKDWLSNRGLQTIEQSHSFCERCCAIVEMCRNSRRHYEFEMFVLFSLFASLGFVELTLLHQISSIPNYILMRLLVSFSSLGTELRLSVPTLQIHTVTTSLRYLEFWNQWGDELTKEKMLVQYHEKLRYNLSQHLLQSVHLLISQHLIPLSTNQIHLVWLIQLRTRRIVRAYWYLFMILMF